MVAITFDYESRVRKLQKALSDRDLDGAVLFRPEHIYYFGGFWGYWTWRPIGLVVPSSGKPALICPAIESAQARASTWMDDVRVYVEWQGNAPRDPFLMMLDVLREKGLTRGKLGIEGSYLPVNAYQRLQTVVPGGMLDVEDLCLQLRCIKEPAEIELYRQGGQVVAAEAKAAVEAIRPGVSEYEITLAAKAAGTRAAAQFLGPDERQFSPLVRGLQMLTAGVDRAAWVHGRTSTHRLAKDDVVYMCFCEITSFRGYELGFDRTARVETLSPEQRRMLNAVLAAQDAAFSKARAGEFAANLDAAANAVLEKSGLLQYRLHRTGRGVGVAPVEPPIITSSDEKTVLRSGMVLCISPGVYVPGVGNAHIGDTILITDSGFERLIPFPGNLWD